MQLGATYPRLNYIAEEPLAFRWYRFSLYYDPTTTRILIPIRSIRSHERTSALTRRLSTTLFLGLKYRQ
jgi:hypothetical protein